MKNLMTKTMKTLAVAGMTMGLVQGAWAANVAVAVKSPDNMTLTFYYDEVNHSSEGTVYVVPESVAKENDIPWYRQNNPITSVVFDASFSDCRPTSTAYWFNKFKSLTGITDIQYLNTSSVTNMASMFNVCKVLTALDVSNFDTAKVTNMGLIFSGCKVLTALDVRNFDTAKVTDMNCMFQSCTSLPALDVRNFDTANVTDMNRMFNGCKVLTALDVSNFDTAKVTNMNGMFSGCTSLPALDVSGFDTAKVTDMNGMFGGCSELTTIYASDAFKANQVEASADMFTGCTVLVGGNETVYDPNHVDAEYARIDGENGSPGYFTRGKTAITIEDVTGAEVTEVSTNGVPVAGPPYTVMVDAAVKVVYTATPGYVFPNGKTEFTTNVTARAYEMTVTLTADQQPIPLPQVTYLAPVYNTDGDSKSGIKEWKTLSTNVYQFVTNDTATLTEGWWVVDGTVSRGGITVSGAAHLILKDGCSLTAQGEIQKAGITVTGDGNSLAIYGQSAGTGELTATGGSCGAGIGGGFSGAGSNIAINGGTVTAKGGATGAGIGGGLMSNGENITINGGTVTATGVGFGAGIGGGNVGLGKGITINGGTVEATSDDSGAGIGGGCSSSGMGITITGGTVTANGGASGAGIGGGCGHGEGDGLGMNITITGGTVTANGGASGAGIGGGKQGSGSNITINGGTVTANGGDDATGIGNGYDALESASNIKVSPELLLKAGASENPTTVIAVGRTAEQDIANDLMDKRYATVTDLPTEPIASSPTLAPANATLAVYTNGVLSADGTVWSNRTAEVVYRANAGYYFANGATVITNKLDTSVNPAVNKAGEVVPTSTGTPKVQLGVVAQRYPWNGILDIQYKTPYANASVTVTFYVNGIELGTAQGTGGQSATASFDLNAVPGGAFKDKALKNVKITAAIAKRD